MAKGAAWNFFHLIVGRGIALVTRVILASMLLPQHFGVFAAIMLFIGLATTVADLGVQTALIHRDLHHAPAHVDAIANFGSALHRT